LTVITLVSQLCSGQEAGMFEHGIFHGKDKKAYLQ
jgi:hypothetical protein